MLRACACDGHHWEVSEGDNGDREDVMSVCLEGWGSGVGLY